jgi:hypothetical protein
MPTYTNNLGIELIANGEEDGTWGIITNDNFSILDRAINGSVALTLTGTTSTLTTSDGTLSDGQYKALILGGSPSGTHTITIAPNDAQKIYFVVNGTAQSVVLTQGSGGNVTVPAGRSALVYADGGGASAAVADFSANLVPVLSNAGVTASTAELNILDGVTSTTAELNILDGVTATTAELNFVDGVTSNVQTQLDAKASAASPTLTGEPFVDGSYRGNVVAVAALDIDCAAGNYFTKTISANSTFTFSNAPASRSYGFTLELTHTSGAVTWPASVTFPRGVTPTLTTGKTHLFMFVTDDGGTRWRGAALVDYDN